MSGRVGQTVKNLYLLIQFLGNGSFGDVYLGEHIREKTRFAVKILRDRLTNENIKEFVTEAGVCQLLRHEHIIRLYDYGLTDDHIPFLIMDYASNGTLLKRHPRGTRLSLDTVVSYVQPIASALQYAHNKEVIHRDVKPENILLGEDGKILVSDFGIAVVAQSSRSQKTGNPGGTPTYMAPEQCQGKPLCASDQYALGVIVYEWLSGNPPFHGTPLQIMYHHLSTPPPPFKNELRIPPAIEDVVRKALAKDPKVRFACVKEFADELERASQANSSISMPPSIPQQPTIVRPDPVQPPRVSPLQPTLLPPSLPPTQEVEDSYGPPWKQTNRPGTDNSDSRITYPSSEMTWGTPPKQPQTRAISRRKVIVGLAVTGLLAVGGSILWQTVTSELMSHNALYTYAPPINGPGDPLEIITWSPDGRHVAFASQYDIYVWDVLGGSKASSLPNSGGAYSIEWFPDGRHIAATAPGASNSLLTQVWDATNGQPPQTYEVTLNDSSGVSNAAWSPNGKRIMVIYKDQYFSVWDVVQKRFLFPVVQFTIETLTSIGIAWSPNSKDIAFFSGTQVQIWDAITGISLRTYQHSSDVNSVAWAPSGVIIASAGGDYDSSQNQSTGDLTVHVWNAFTGKDITRYAGHSQYVTYLAWSPDTKFIASASWDTTVQVWNAATGDHVLTYNGYSDPVETVAWSSNGKYIASGGWDGRVKVWQAPVSE